MFSAPKTDTDRSLLIGIFALRRGFLTEEDLLRVLNAWADAPATPIRKVFLEQGGLTPDHQAELEPLVERQMLAHAGQAKESTVDHIARERETSVHPGLAENDPHKTGAPDPIANDTGLGTLSSAGKRFYILRPHAQGGLGKVSVARDEELNREVALKEIQDRHADNATSRSRFLFEAKVTGTLEHPGVVPVYGLGVNPDGRPFYAMRLIQGSSLKKAIHELHTSVLATPGARAAELRKLLDRFKTVCNTMAYAHSRRVIHRDLKPDNVLLGDYGETLVVDWGLAKDLNRNDDPSGVETRSLGETGFLARTQMGQVMGTPQYMSPEQAEGRLEQMGPATDVYSLGATLFCLLTGEAPYQDRDPRGIVRKMKSGEIPAARQARPDVPVALEAICLKAMALKPEDRYSSPKDMAEDLEKWLADDPVSAYPEPWTVRTRRWMGRHRTLLTSGVAVLVMAVASLSIIAALLTGKNNALEAAYKSEQTAKEEATEQRDQAKALFRLAAVVFGEMGATKNAADIFENAASDTQKLADAHPDVDEYQQILAQAHGNLGLWYKQTGKSDDAEQAMQKAAAIYQALAQRHPEVMDYHRMSSQTLVNLEVLYSEMGRFEDGLSVARRAFTLRQELADARPDEPMLQADLAQSHGNLAVLYQEMGRIEDAERAHRDALSIREKLENAHPHVLEFVAPLASSYYNMGHFLQDQDRPENAERALQRALELRNGIVDALPNNSEYQADVADTHNELGAVYRSTKRNADAQREFHTALRARRKLAATYRNMTEYQSDLAGCLQNLGVVYQEDGQLKEAEEAFKEALPIEQRLADSYPQITKFQTGLAGNYNALANLFGEQKRPEEAEKAYYQALVIQERLVRDHPLEMEFAGTLGGIYGNIAHLLRENNKALTALGWYARAIRMQRQVLRRDPRNARSRRNLVEVQQGRDLAVLGSLLHSDAAAVAKDWDRALELYTGPDRAFFQLQRARAWARQGDHARAAAAALAVSKGESPSGENLYDAAAVYAVAVAAVAKDDQLKPNEKDELAGTYAANAVAALRQAREAGFLKAPVNVDFLTKDPKDPDFAPIRERKEFKELLAELAVLNE